ncbi:MAG: Gfo/Idh/MocA family oxidoreductase, partial [Planctomycetia bacterium]|nr:Gfo/Idh/MocA family oxidoreductase [Planctomycetia bacterium]
LGVIEASTACYPGHLKRIEIHGTAGSVVMEEEDFVKWDFVKARAKDEAIHERMAKRVTGGGGAADPAAIGHHGHARQFQDVVKAIQKRTRPSIDGAEGRRSVEVILAIYKAAETGRAVPLPLAGDPVLKARKSGVGE